MHDATNDAPIIRSLNTSHICRQMGFNPIPLLIAQPKEVRPHDPDPRNESGRYGIRIALPPQQN
jgi:uncharacterized protein